MSQDIRRELIAKNLGIKPINHGQVYSFQIALPDSRKQEISLVKRQAIENSLLEHQSNLVSLIIRRTEAYADDDIEYELVYGAAWLQIAQELEIEKIWAWVFDMTDEQAIATVTEMNALIGNTQHTSESGETSDPIANADSNIGLLIEQKLQYAVNSIKNSIAPILNEMRVELDEKLKIINHRIDTLSHVKDNSNLSELKTVLDKLDVMQKQIGSSKKIMEPVSNPINLIKASEQDIKIALKKVNSSGPNIQSAINAIKYWRKSEQGLSWGNLEISAGASKKSEYKIKGFARGTYEKLQRVADIPEENRAD